MHREDTTYEVCTVVEFIYDRTHSRASTGFKVILYNLRDRRVSISVRVMPALSEDLALMADPTGPSGLYFLLFLFHSHTIVFLIVF